MFLGIEIGGTKLQVGVGSGSGKSLQVLQRAAVERQHGAEGIREKVAEICLPLIHKYNVQCIGIGFGGPVDAGNGIVLRSFQISGCDGFPLTQWCRDRLGVPAVLENDSNLAGLGEARFGAGIDSHVVLYSNVGSGIGGALVIADHLYLGGVNAAVAEIGHLRPGLDATEAVQTVESIASGWGIANQARSRIEKCSQEHETAAQELLGTARGELEELTGKMVVAAAAAGNVIAQQVFQEALRTYGWALAQAITLTAPNVVVVGGGVSQVGETLFFAPLRQYVEQYVMPPLRGTYEMRPAALGEEVVVHGALALAADNDRHAN